MDNNDDTPRDPKPTRMDLAELVQRLVQLRNALEETALALSDYRCTIDSEERRAAQLLVLQLIDKAKARDYSGGEGH
jgi:hypothetical protein